MGTSTALFIGRTGKGRLNFPVRCTSYSDFVREFSDSNAVGDMARYVRLFFLNGGTDAYVMRIANGATFASVTLRTEADDPALELTAKQAGALGETIRAAVTYAGPRPEATFNIRLFRWETDAAGRRQAVDVEEWKNLSMDPNSPLFAPDILTQQSALVNAAVAAGAPAATNGYSQSGRPVSHPGNGGGVISAWTQIFGTNAAAAGNQFEISVDGLPYIRVDLGSIDVSSLDDSSVANARAAIADEIRDAIEDALAAAGHPGVQVDVQLLAGPPAVAAGEETSVLRISSMASGDIFIRPAPMEDLAVPLMLGTEQGGLEVGAHAGRRPAPTGITLRMSRDGAWQVLASRQQDSVTAIRLDEQQADGSFAPVDIPVDLATTAGGEPFYRDNLPASRTDNNDGVREKLARIRDAVNAYRVEHNRTFFWTAEVWGNRLAFLPASGDDNWIGSFGTLPNADDLGAVANLVTRNVRLYSVGVSGTAGLQDPAPAVASDGTAPTAADYEAALPIIRREVDLFNLMVLPPDAEPAVAMTDVWGPLSVFCQEQRAFLLMDPPTAWTDAQQASTGVAALRAGLVADHSAIFYPRITIRENGRDVNVGPTGAIAGLMARIDGTRGVWKAPAGTEADLRGVVGLERRLSDRENGIINPRAVNALRVFPTGIVNWGARTMAGDDDFASEWKYIPIRRLALMIEESLYRGLQWVVFEPNDEGLWAQIRLNVGAFMHGLFRKGAFQGQKPSDAYFVKCDAETTTQADRNLGVVNIWVGFAPLKPAEFVVLYLQQMAGQIQV
ncbi:MAG TPA: phage tail sheath C-terminal domain-containing protein [Longimicrobiales bacterium]|nr:phage tail sheath C-terminal domain-containing protein [Longimicrobiales bacterium]